MGRKIENALDLLRDLVIPIEIPFILLAVFIFLAPASFWESEERLVRFVVAYIMVFLIYGIIVVVLFRLVSKYIINREK